MKYSVMYYYHSNAVVEVEAENEREAIEKGRNLVTDEQIMESLIEQCQPDVEQI